MTSKIKTITLPLVEYETLLARVSFLEKRVEELLAQNQNLIAENILLRTENAELRAKNASLEEKVSSLNQRLFGKKKDKIKCANDNKLKRFWNSEQEKKARGRKPIDKSIVPNETRRYDFVSIPKCKQCDKEMHFMGNDESHHMDYQAEFNKVKIIQAKYGCRHCNKIIVANGAKLPIPKGLPMPGLLTKAVLDKFSNASPTYRQEQNYSYMGINYSRQMLCQWYERVAYLIEPLISLMFEKILQSDYIMADETTLPLLNAADKLPGSNGYMCVVKQGGESFSFVYCFAIASRKQETIRRKLSKFKGHLQTDGLNFYFKLQEQEGIRAVGCWSHARRKFVDIVKLSDKSEGVAFTVVEMIKKLYVLEKDGKALSEPDLYQLRQKEALPILNEMYDYFKRINAPPKSSLGKAIRYTLERWDALTEYVRHPKLAIDNNATERCIKYIVIGRKNWLFAKTEESANALAKIYSLVITCKVNNINPQEYLEYVFTQLPYINKHNSNELEQFLPDRVNMSKRFDQEYRNRLGISESIVIENNTEDITLAA